ncbi:MAG: hypothetical protein J4400_04445 [Candidatus Aenigmarchaeota archaeon]|nr:hypothetical protein [Candidatus Aenigmarchaeota archaeon]
MKKSLLVILDGVADKKSALAKAKKPNLDMLASNSTCGIWSGPHAPHYNPRSMSSVATLEILGYSWHDEPGRGYLEALGIGLKLKKSDVCVRGNFATVRGKTIRDRRAGRDERGLDVMVKDLNRQIKSIDGIKTKLCRAVGHRLVLVLSGKGLSIQVSDGDMGSSPQKIKPLNPGARKTSDILNKYVERSRLLLLGHPSNKKRKFPANFILLRSAGAYRKVGSFNKKYRMKACSISGVNIVRGTSEYLGIDIINTPLSQLEDDLLSRARKAADALEKYDFVILHINGADTNAHNRDFSGKVKYIEKIDREVFSQVVRLRHINIAVISDHITDSSTGNHVFGPVPFLIYAADEDADGGRFDEKSCRGSFVADNPMKKMLSVNFSYKEKFNQKK